MKTIQGPPFHCQRAQCLEVRVKLPPKAQKKILVAPLVSWENSEPPLNQWKKWLPPETTQRNSGTLPNRRPPRHKLRWLPNILDIWNKTCFKIIMLMRYIELLETEFIQAHYHGITRFSQCLPDPLAEIPIEPMRVNLHNRSGNKILKLPVMCWSWSA